MVNLPNRIRASFSRKRLNWSKATPVDTSINDVRSHARNVRSLPSWS